MNGTELQAIHNGGINGKDHSGKGQYGRGHSTNGTSNKAESDIELSASPKAGHEQSQTMQQAVTRALEQFWDTLEGDQPSNLYELVINHVERPLLETVMVRCEFNQSRAAQCLGITRSTLRKKLRCHGLIDCP